MIRAIMKPILFYDNRSPPVRSCLMLIKCLGIDVELKEIDLFKQDHLSPDFLKVNPLHTVPALTDGDLTLTDSHAILIHLASKYGTDSNIYPKDDVTRMKVINRLFFECAILFRRDSDMMTEIFRTAAKDVGHYEKKIHETYGFLEQYLTESEYVACDNMTIADFSIVTTLSTVNLIFPVTAGNWPRLNAWFAAMKTLPYYSTTNEVGLDRLKKALKDFAGFELPRNVSEDL